MEQLYLIKRSMEDFRSENDKQNHLELIETVKEEIRYLRNENITKTFIINFLAENQATDHVNNNTKSPSTGHYHPDRRNSENLTPRRNNTSK